MNSCRSLLSVLGLLLLLAVASFAQSDLLSTPDGKVMIPGGSYQMGISWTDIPELVAIGRKVPHMNIRLARAWFGDETPRHTVTVEPFFMDSTEVTNAQFRAFVEATGYEAEGVWEKYATEGRDDQPVVNVSWNDANAFAQWAGKRLPTEEEWEYAAEGGQDHKWYPWGNTPDPSKAMWRHQGETFFAGIWRLMGLRKMNSQPVASYPPNGYGLYDMVGNVSEWTSSRYQPYPGFEEYPDGPSPWIRRDQDLRDELRHVVRGGNWEDPNPVFVNIRRRNGRFSTDARWSLGFRCVKSVDGSE